MICDRMKELHVVDGYSQSQLTKKLDGTSSSVNAWETELSTPTTQYVVALAKLFHVSAYYLLGLETEKHLVLDGYSHEEIELVFNLTKYFDSKK